MRRLRAILYGVWLYGVTVVLTVLFLPLLVLPREALRRAIHIWAKLAIWGLRIIGGVRLEIRGAERLPPGALLIAAKHQSMFDIIPPWAAMHDPIFVMKTELMGLPLFGWLCRKAEMVEVDRGAAAQAMRKLIVDARDRLKEPRQLIIFPEGTRQKPGSPPVYKPGVAGIYRDLGLTCVPVATNSGVHLDIHGLAQSPGVVVLEILEPIPPGLKRADFMRLLEERIETASNALLREGL
jgi:1-acyl-sn-glycerol-3-phosphate acyltransferase